MNRQSLTRDRHQIDIFAAQDHLRAERQLPEGLESLAEIRCQPRAFSGVTAGAVYVTHQDALSLQETKGSTETETSDPAPRRRPALGPSPLRMMSRALRS